MDRVIIRTKGCAMLRLHFKNSNRNPIWANKASLTLGSAPNCDVVLDKDQPEALATLETSSTQTLLKPAPGIPVKVNGQAVPENGVAIHAGDTITHGALVLQVVDPLASANAMKASVEKLTGATIASKSRAGNQASSPWTLVGKGGLLQGKRYPLAGTLVFGRDSSADIVIAGTHLSRKHVELSVKAGAIAVKDLNSSNGTFINGKRVSEGFLKNGDELMLDTLKFRVEGPSDDKDKTVVASAINVPNPIRNPDEINWKTKPTSRGNNYKTTVMDAAQKEVKPSPLPWIIGAAVVAAIGIAAAVFLL